MAKDDIQICNMALSRIGVSLKIANLTDWTTEAIELNQVYAEVRDRVLAAAPWPFARKFVSLQRTGSTPFLWKYRFEYPNNCLAVRRVLPAAPSGLSGSELRRWALTSKVPFNIELDGDDTLSIVSDVDIAVAEITVRVTNPVRFDAPFTNAFCWALGGEVALPLAKTVDHAKNAGQMYNLAINEAIAKALNEEVPDEKPDSEFVLARL